MKVPSERGHSAWELDRRHFSGAVDIQSCQNRLSPGHEGFDPLLSGRPCRSPLWSGLVVRLMASEQEHCQVVLDNQLARSGGLCARIHTPSGNPGSGRRIARRTRWLCKKRIRKKPAIRVETARGPTHSRASTHHQDQSMTPVNLRTSRTTCRGIPKSDTIRRRAVRRAGLGWVATLREYRADADRNQRQAKSSPVRPSDRRRILPHEDQCQGWRLRHRRSRRGPGAVLTMISCAATECPARGARPGQLRVAVTAQGALGHGMRHSSATPHPGRPL